MSTMGGRIIPYVGLQDLFRERESSEPPGLGISGRSDRLSTSRLLYPASDFMVLSTLTGLDCPPGRFIASMHASSDTLKSVGIGLDFKRKIAVAPFVVILIRNLHDLARFLPTSEFILALPGIRSRQGSMATDSDFADFTGEELSVLAYAEPPIQPAGLGPIIVALVYVMSIITTLIVGLRIWARTVYRDSAQQWGTEDYLAVVGFVRLSYDGQTLLEVEEDSHADIGTAGNDTAPLHSSWCFRHNGG